MQITITNHHCDSRDIPVPGAGIVRLPAFGTISFRIASDSQVRELAGILAVRAPAAHISFATVAIPNDADEIAPETACEPSPADVVAADIPSVEPPQKPDIQKTKPQKQKKRGRKT